MGHTARDEGMVARLRQVALPRLGLGDVMESRFVELHFLADPSRVAFRFEGLPDVRVPDEDAKEMRRKLVENFSDAPRDLPAPPGYTPWISMGNTGWALDGAVRMWFSSRARKNGRRLNTAMWRASKLQ